MASAADWIAQLDRMLATDGEPVTLQQLRGGAVRFQADVTAFVRGYAANELVGGIIQGDGLAIISPTGLTAAGWPVGDAELPRAGDKVLIAGRTRGIVSAEVKRVAGTVARIDLQVRG